MHKLREEDATHFESSDEIGALVQREKKATLAATHIARLSNMGFVIMSTVYRFIIKNL